MNIDFSECEREPIHCPGTIQPIGVLIAVDEQTLEVVQISENSGEWLGVDARSAVGRGFAAVLGDRAAAVVRNANASAPIEDNPIYVDTFTWSTPRGPQPLYLVVHRRSGMLLVELEPAPSDEQPSFRSLYFMVRSLMSKLEVQPTVADVAAIITQKVRHVTGFDRVMVYRFDHDWHGEIIAEDRNDELPSYLGVHFPATDIPRQAREMYRLNRLRGIADANHEPVPLIGAPGSPALDLTFSALRSVSPRHIEYMKNMGTMSSTSISILRQGELWGLLVCHNRTPRRLMFEERAACELLGQLFSHELVSAELRESAVYRSALKGHETLLLSNLSCAEDLSSGLVANGEALLACTGSEGAAFLMNDECVLFGQTPRKDEVLRLAGWLKETAGAQPVFATDKLASLFPEAAGYVSVASGVLSVALSWDRRSHILWFRPERVTTVTWGGAYELSPTANGKAVVEKPERSFALWRQIMRGCSLPWAPSEIDTAANIRHGIMTFVMRIAGERAELSSAAKLATASNRAKSVFLASMSHEIRTPMNAILGYSELMLRDASLTHHAKENLKIINRTGQHLLSLINDILNMSKIEAGRMDLNPTPFDPGALVYELVTMFRLRAENKGLRFELIADEGCTTGVMADEGKIRQVLINLVGNAIKFTERGRVSARVSIKARDDGRLWLSALVEDTGVGIALDDQKRLFQPFTQLHRGERRVPGTGLGLAISSEFARLMGGQLTLNSELGKGAAFHFEVPVQPADVAAIVTPAPACVVSRLAPGQGSPRVLIVDNESTSRGWLNQLLTSLGFSVREAVDGEAAVRTWQEWRPRLVLMDLDMPGMNGLEAIRAIRSHPAAGESVIIVLSASAFEEEMKTALQYGAEAYLPKPCREQELMEKIRKLLDLTYLYADEAASPEPTSSRDESLAETAESLATIPGALLKQLRASLLIGDKSQIDTLIDAVRGLDERLARMLQDLADNYEYDRLSHLLESHGPEAMHG